MKLLMSLSFQNVHIMAAPVPVPLMPGVPLLAVVFVQAL
jgi:hypothetical protein